MGSLGTHRRRQQQSVDIIAVQKWAYLDKIPKGLAPFRQLLQAYSGVSEEQMDSHLLCIREAAWKISRFPCVGRWKFLDLNNPLDPRYQHILFRLTVRGSKDALLDLGCCVGQILRQFRQDGVDGSRLFGLDKDRRFIDIGYDLFRDKATLGAKFVVGDIFTDSHLRALRGQITIVHATSFFHLFTWSEQLEIGKVLVTLLRPGTKNALIYGRQAGMAAAKGAPMFGTAGGESESCLHDEASLQRLWDQIGLATSTRWVVNVSLARQSIDLDSLPGLRMDVIPIEFTIHQVA